MRNFGGGVEKLSGLRNFRKGGLRIFLRNIEGVETFSRWV